MERTPLAFHRPKVIARARAATSVSRPCAASSAASSASCGPSLVLPEAAALASHCSATGPSAQNACSAADLGRTLRAGVFGRGRP